MLENFAQLMKLDTILKSRTGILLLSSPRNLQRPEGNVGDSINCVYEVLCSCGCQAIADTGISLYSLHYNALINIVDPEDDGYLNLFRTCTVFYLGNSRRGLAPVA